MTEISKTMLQLAQGHQEIVNTQQQNHQTMVNVQQQQNQVKLYSKVQNFANHILAHLEPSILLTCYAATNMVHKLRLTRFQILIKIPQILAYLANQ